LERCIARIIRKKENNEGALTEKICCYCLRKKRARKIKKFKMTTFEPKNYLEVPTEDELEQEVVKFFESNGDDKRKCGITTRAEKRYGKKDFWNIVQQLDHFGYSSNFSVARQIELMVIAILKRRGWHFEHQDTGPGRRAQKEESFVIYLITGKSPEDRCPICSRVWIKAQDKRQQHLDQHAKEKESWKWVKEMGEKHGNSEAIDDANEILEWPLKGEAGAPAAKKAKL
jgi:hypothetical protein